MTEQTVLDRLRVAFPLRHRCTTSDHVFDLGPRAKIYVRKKGRDTHRARILAADRRDESYEWTWHLDRFPNSDELRRVVEDIHPRAVKTKIEYLFGPHNVDRLIEALRP